MFWVLVGLLEGAGTADVAPPTPPPILGGGYDEWGYLRRPKRRLEARPEPEIVAEIVEAATVPVFRKPRRAELPAIARPVRINESEVISALEAARREWQERDDDDAFALALILANA